MGEFIISSSVLILFVIVLRILFGRRIGFRMRYAMWLIVVLRLALPFTMPDSPVSIMNVVHRVQSVWERETAAGQDGSREMETGYADTATAADSLPGEEAGGGMMLMIRRGAAEVSRTDIKQGTTGSDSDSVLRQNGPLKERAQLTSFLPMIWLAGAACIGVYLLTINLIVWGRLRRMRVLVDPVGSAQNGAELPVYRCEKLASPCLFGLWRPAVYLNGKALADERSCHYAMAHEWEHYRHKDHIWSFVRLAAVTVYWFHPLVWAAAALSARDCELACDEGVTARITEEECMQYGRALLSQVPLKRGGLCFTVCSSMSSGARQIKKRLLAVTHRRKISVGAILLTTALLLLITGCTFTGAEDRSPDMGENGVHAGMADAAAREGNDAESPAVQVSTDAELLSLFEESMRIDEDGNVCFTIPKSDHRWDDWTFSLGGKECGSSWSSTLTYNDLLVSSEISEGQADVTATVWIGGGVPDNSEWLMVVSLSSFSEDGEETRTMITIDLSGKP